jgi:transcriptional regulator with XRE-family HTH domain
MKLKSGEVATRRKLLGLTQVQLGELLGVSETSVVAWERGHVSLPRPERLAALAEALQTNTRELVVMDDDDSSDVPAAIGAAPGPAPASEAPRTSGAGAPGADTDEAVA